MDNLIVSTIEIAQFFFFNSSLDMDFVKIFPLTWLTLEPNNFVHTNLFAAKPVPMDRSESGLSNGTGFVTNGPFLIKLLGSKVSALYSARQRK